ncbi:hypothetical protein [Rhizobium leguminosarum]|uniref:hypothetical protein n=1 Tax=Rhizobium leguminosarum TaxID=384 RepID=UPI0006868825|nr:hypothetical protein [Rhizobium leguminosarum]
MISMFRTAIRYRIWAVDHCLPAQAQGKRPRAWRQAAVYWAACAIISMLILALRRFSKIDGRVTPIIVLLSGLAVAAFYPTRNLDIASTLMALLGAGYNLSRVLIDVEIQRLVSSTKLGRAKGRVHVACMGFSLLVYVGLGVSGDALVPSAVFLAFGSGVIAVVTAGYGLHLVKKRASLHRSMPL